VANENFPVAGRSAAFTARLAAHEIGHTLVGKCIGTFIHLVTIVPDLGYQGRTVRSGPVSELDLNDDSKVLNTTEVISVCESLLELEPELGSNRIASSEHYQRCIGNIMELVAGQEAELLLHSDQPVLGAVHDFVEADAFAKLAVVASPSVEALIKYCQAESRGLLEKNIDIARALVAALIAKGTLLTDEIDQIISATVVARAVEAERVRRNDWHRREQSAAEFLKGITNVE
jgi:hypothetical protein